MSEPALRESLESALGVPVVAMHAVAGGDVNHAYRCELRNGERIFLKSHPAAAQGMFVREAEGLAWLAEAGVHVPDVIAVADTTPRWLALTWLDRQAPGANFDAELGEMLGRMHAFGATDFGAAADNFIGPLPQPNAPLATFADFYAERRLRPMARRAHTEGHLSRSDLRDVETLAGRLDTLVPEEPPARLHGDLWSGNVMSAGGRPWLIDPACYGGHREVDLAMLALFGRVSHRTRAAYEAVRPLSPGADERTALFQLYPVLVHAALFGGGYGSQAGSLARRYN